MASDSAPVNLSAAGLVHGSQASQKTTATPAASNAAPAPSRVSAPQAAGAVVTNAGVPATAAAAGSSSAAAGTANTDASPRNAGATSSGAQHAGPAPNSGDLQALVAQLNKHLNDSGRPDQYRVDPQSSGMIQEVNPANGAVIAEFSADEFPALARSVGASGLLVDSLA